MSEEKLGPQHVAINNTSDHPIIRLLISRLFSASERQSRKDDAVIATAMEGGGMAGVIGSGMCVVFEKTCLIDGVDQIYGTSSGALNGMYTAAGKGAQGATNYEDILTSDFAGVKHLIKGKYLNLDYLFKNVIRDQKPVYLSDLENGPTFGAIAVDIDKSEAVVLSNFSDTDEMITAVRASCAMPVLSGRVIRYKGQRLTDGAMLASIPYQIALNNGATHVVALRTRSPDYRKHPYKNLEIVGSLLGGIKIAKLTKARPTIYNAEAEELQRGKPETLMQINPELGYEPVTQLERSLLKIRYGFTLGVMATAKTFGIPDVTINWNTNPPELLI